MLKASFKALSRGAQDMVEVQPANQFEIRFSIMKLQLFSPNSCPILSLAVARAAGKPAERLAGQLLQEHPEECRDPWNRHSRGADVFDAIGIS